MTRAEITAALGELLLVGVPGTEPEPALLERLRAIGPSGVILFASNFTGAAGAARLARALHDALGSPGQPPLVALDEEGGMVSQLAGFWEVPPNARAVAASGGPSLVENLARRTARRLLALGANLDFAPCLDVQTNPRNPVIGIRSFGGTAPLVTDCGRAAIAGLRAEGVLPSAKHFPGHGDTSLDSHVALPRCEAMETQILVRELRPFETAIREGVPLVMTAHVLFPALEPDPRRPATLSHTIVTGLLRERLAFDGVVSTDALEMEGVRGIADWGEVALLAIEAGCDLLLYSKLEPGPEAALAALRGALDSGRLAPERVEASLARLRRLRSEARVPSPLTDALLEEARDLILPDELDGIASHALRVLRQGPGTTPLRGPIDVLEVNRPPSRAPLADLLRARGADAREHGPDPAGWPGRIEGSAVLTVAARARVGEQEERTAREWLRRHPRTVTVATLNPHVTDGWEEVGTLYATFDNTPASRRALAARLLDGPAPAGKRW